MTGAMTGSPLHALATLLTLLGLVSATLVLARSRNVQLTVAVLLEFLLGAGLLRLSDNPSWRALATAALLVVVRKLLTFGLGQAQRRRAAFHPPG